MSEWLLCLIRKFFVYLLCTNAYRAMTTTPQSSPELALASSPPTDAAICPRLAALKAQAKALKKWRKQERLRFFSACCASFHALGFSF